MDTFLAFPIAPWAEMWVLAGSLYLLVKAASWRFNNGASTPGQRAAYLLGWPGMDPQAFFSGRSWAAPSQADWLFAAAKLTFGVTLLVFAVLFAPADQPLVAGWLGMIGCVFVLHFGLFELLSCWWRSCGYGAVPLMNWPIAARSVGEFWGQRWNRAFRDLTHRFLFRPLEPRVGASAALIIGFFVSGLVHELVISLPAGGGYGGPTCYFVLQAIGIMCEHSRFGRSWGLRRSAKGRLFAALLVAGPAPLLFHPPFVGSVFVPFLQALRVLP